MYPSVSVRTRFLVNTTETAILNEPFWYLYSAQLNITKETTPIKFGLYQPLSAEF